MQNCEHLTIWLVWQWTPSKNQSAKSSAKKLFDKVGQGIRAMLVCMYFYSRNNYCIYFTAKINIAMSPFTYMIISRAVIESNNISDVSAIYFLVVQLQIHCTCIKISFLAGNADLKFKANKLKLIFACQHLRPETTKACSTNSEDCVKCYMHSHTYIDTCR